ncbi:hypothetical protein LshimejAT787_0310660 [Lyophyllum shimeji]|uniref:WD40 repeat-like protein n=1 Tax=Lyophyllum shimeji TaxID=47721 RepID=A0A9P3PJU5_LYOSH|nr:hypothetical protein LshimejAT787_0310660 [Lyophyllum shimeji]
MGMAGTGKSTISHSLCKMLDAENMLGASFFCSRGSETARNARLIVPTIAYGLASTSSAIKSDIIQAIGDDPRLAEPTYIDVEDQFNKFIRRPIISRNIKTYKVIVIDGLDECSDLPFVSKLIRLILKLSRDLPLKLFIASRDEQLIHNALYSSQDLLAAFPLHEVEERVVEHDIRLFIKKSLLDIQKSLLDIESPGLDRTLEWPAPFELSKLVEHSGRLFIYAVTALRYIREGGKLFKRRLSCMANREPKLGSKQQTSMIDDLYGHILQQACASQEEGEILDMRRLLSIIIFLRNPMPIYALTEFAKIDADVHLSALKAVIHVPAQPPEAAVAPFHASFPDFVTDPSRCSPERCPSFAALIHAECHIILALRCMDLMNSSLKYNICGIPSDMTVSRQGQVNSPEYMTKISEELKYACVYWASHLVELQELGSDILPSLRHFLVTHLLHWIECLSILGELETALRSLESANTALLRSKATDVQCRNLQLLVEDALRCLQSSFEAVRRNAFEIYQSAFVWLPKESLVRKAYSPVPYSLPRVVLGLHDSWPQEHLIVRRGSAVSALALSHDGSQAASGSSADNMVRIWNTTTGLLEAELKGHTHPVTSVAFSRSGKVASGSWDKTVGIWDVRTRELEAKLRGHTKGVTSVAFSPIADLVCSGSKDCTLGIWDAKTRELQDRLRGHTRAVNSVSFSPDGSRILSGSSDARLRIWNADRVEADFRSKGNRAKVTSAAFSQDGKRVVSGTQDGTVRIWDVATRNLEAELKGHTAQVTSVAFSSDGSRVVSGSNDRTVRVWNAMNEESEAELEGHTAEVCSVAFFQDGKQVISGSWDGTIRIWNTAAREAGLSQHASPVTCLVFSQDGEHLVYGSESGTIWIRNAGTGEIEAELEGHTAMVSSVAFSHDGSRLVSASRDWTVRVWDTHSIRAVAEFKGHTASVSSAVFSPDGNRLVVPGWPDKTARILDVATGKVMAELRVGAQVWCVAFSMDGSQIATGSSDATIRIWNATTGEAEGELIGHTHGVRDVAFSQDGSQVISSSGDRTVRVWDKTTGQSDMVTTRYLQLLDSTEIFIHDARGTKTFGIAYPKQPSALGGGLAHSVSEDGQWILGDQRDCWIPPHYRDLGELVFSGSRVSFASSKGRLVILDMKGT